jgi:hypothetical protein
MVAAHTARGLELLRGRKNVTGEEVERGGGGIGDEMHNAIGDGRLGGTQFRTVDTYADGNGNLLCTNGQEHK